MLSGSRVCLILHLKHNGDIFRIIVIVPEDKVTLAPTAGIIVLLEVGVWI